MIIDGKYEISWKEKLADYNILLSYTLAVMELLQSEYKLMMIAFAPGDLWKRHLDFVIFCNQYYNQNVVLKDYIMERNFSL